MKVIRLYAQVLLDVVLAPGSALSFSEVQKELASFCEIFDESPLFLKVFDNPTLGDDEKQRALAEILSRERSSPFVQKFLGILVRRNRLSLLPEILKAAQSMEIEKKGGLIGELTSAAPLDAATAKEVEDALTRKLQKPVQLKQKVDPAMIAGMKVTVSGVTFDGTVKSRLDRLIENFY